MSLDMEQLQKLLEQIKQKEMAAAQVARRPSQGQAWRNPGQTGADMMQGRTDPAQRRAIAQMAARTLNRPRGQNAVGALSEGFAQGGAVMDEIRAKQKSEAMNAADRETTAAQNAFTNNMDIYKQDKLDTAQDLRYKEYLLDRQKFGHKQDEDAYDRANPKVSVETEKRYNDFYETGRKADEDYARFTSLAEQFEKADYSGGIPTQIAEMQKQLFGNEDQQSAMLKSGRDVVVSAAIQNLPPGVASDKDIELVMKPQPGMFSNPKYLADYMRARANVSKLRSEYANFAQMYMENNRTQGNRMIGLNSAWKLHKIPPEAKEMLRQNPDLRSVFDEKYGKGMAGKVLEVQ